MATANVTNPLTASNLLPIIALPGIRTGGEGLTMAPLFSLPDNARVVRMMRPFLNADQSRRVFRFLAIGFVFAFVVTTLIVAIDKLSPWLPPQTRDVVQSAWIAMVGFNVAPVLIWWADRRRRGR